MDIVQEQTLDVLLNGLATGEFTNTKLFEIFSHFLEFPKFNRLNQLSPEISEALSQDQNPEALLKELAQEVFDIFRFTYSFHNIEIPKGFVIDNINSFIRIQEENIDRQSEKFKMLKMDCKLPVLFYYFLVQNLGSSQLIPHAILMTSGGRNVHAHPSLVIEYKSANGSNLIIDFNEDKTVFKNWDDETLSKVIEEMELPSSHNLANIFDALYLLSEEWEKFNKDEEYQINIKEVLDLTIKGAPNGTEDEIGLSIHRYNDYLTKIYS